MSFVFEKRQAKNQYDGISYGEEPAEKQIREGTNVPTARACPECGMWTYVPTGRCGACLSCGYSACG